jgi:hypothetical protein
MRAGSFDPTGLESLEFASHSRIGLHKIELATPKLKQQQPSVAQSGLSHRLPSIEQNSAGKSTDWTDNSS